MIAANELRIGNWVISQGKEIQVDIIEIHYDEIDMPINPEPIPLTEEWLLKFGFYKPFLRFTKVNGGGWDYLDQNSLRINEYPIKYVHQLQNLFWALCGKELEIKTPAPSQQLPG